LSPWSPQQQAIIAANNNNNNNNNNHNNQSRTSRADYDSVYHDYVVPPEKDDDLLQLSRDGRKLRENQEPIQTGL
jgi:hypothetical protein